MERGSGGGGGGEILAPSNVWNGKVRRHPHTRCGQLCSCCLIIVDESQHMFYR